MFIRDWKKEIFSIPNLLSLFRLLVIPVYITIYLDATFPHHYAAAGGLIIISCLTDIIDGKIARHYNRITTLGKILDPLADKITQFSLTVLLSLKYAELYPVLILFFVKEIFQVAVGLFHMVKGRMLPGALMAGKVCTAILFISLILLVVFPGMNPLFVKIIALIDMLFLFVSFIGYILAYFGKDNKLENLGSN